MSFAHFEAKELDDKNKAKKTNYLTESIPGSGLDEESKLIDNQDPKIDKN
jgi:hypothetical protein